MTDYTDLVRRLRDLAAHRVPMSGALTDAADAIEALQQRVAELETMLRRARPQHDATCGACLGGDGLEPGETCPVEAFIASIDALLSTEAKP